MEPTEFERKMLDAIYNTMTGNFAKGQDAYLDAIRKIMPPTCTATERMFLDEIREKLSIEIIPFTMGKEICIQAGNTRIHQANFGTNLKELVNE